MCALTNEAGHVAHKRGRGMTRKIGGRSIVGAVSAIAIVATLSAVPLVSAHTRTLPHARTVAASPNGTLTVGSTTPVETLDVQDGTVFESLQQVYPLYDSLVRVSQTGTLVPDLALRWTVASNDLSLILYLRQGVTFSDGTPFNAHAVVFNLERETSSTNPYHQYCTCTSPGSWLSTLHSATALGPYTVQLTFSSASASATLFNLSAIPGMMMSPAAIERYGASIGSHAVGTGPFTLVSWSPGAPLIMKRNNNYWGPKPHLSRLIFLSYPSDAARTSALESGQVDAILEPSPSSLPSLKKSYAIISEPLDEVAYVSLDVNKAPFNNVLVRRAFSYAINRKVLAAKIMAGIATPVHGFFPQHLFSADNSLGSHFTYNPAKAKHLLAEAGYPHGLSFNWLVPVSGVASPDPVVWATYVQANLAAVGLHAHIQELTADAEFGIIAKGLQNTQFQAATLGWVVLTGDPDSFVSEGFASSADPPNGFNVSEFNNARLNADVIAGRGSAVSAIRVAAYTDLQKILAAEVPWVPVFTWVDVIVAKHDVSGVQIAPDGVIYFNNARS